MKIYNKKRSNKQETQQQKQSNGQTRKQIASKQNKKKLN